VVASVKVRKLFLSFQIRSVVNLPVSFFTSSRPTSRHTQHTAAAMVSIAIVHLLSPRSETEKGIYLICEYPLSILTFRLLV
jgi:hypothetical protein